MGGYDTSLEKARPTLSCQIPPLPLPYLPTYLRITSDQVRRPSHQPALDLKRGHWQALGLSGMLPFAQHTRLSHSPRYPCSKPQAMPSASFYTPRSATKLRIAIFEQANVKRELHTRRERQPRDRRVPSSPLVCLALGLALPGRRATSQITTPDRGETRDERRETRRRDPLINNRPASFRRQYPRATRKR